MPSLRAEVGYKDKKAEVNFNLACLHYTEKKLHVIYAPALDLFGYGKTETEAKDSFHETLNEFIRYTVNKKTLLKELKRLGWNIKEGKKKSTLAAPNLEELLRDNEQFQNIFAKKEFSKFIESVKVPALV